MKAFLIGLQFLTRIQLLKQTEWDEREFGKSVSYFPLIGAVIGAVLLAIYTVMAPLKVPLLTAFLLVAGEFVVTGAMHADGLMDTCDGLFSGRSRERTLEIMKDSRIGSFGLLAFVFLFLMKTFSLASMDDGHMMAMILLAMPMMGRLNMVISICEYPYARPFGIGKMFNAYRSRHAVGIAFVTTLIPALYFGMTWLLLMGVSLLTGLLLNRWVMGKIGGGTGDTYGCVDEVTELTAAFVLVLLVKGNLWFM